MSAQPKTPRVIVVGNEKGGAGKSTIALHLTAALLHTGARVGVIDLDLRQRSIGRFFANRRAWMEAAGLALPMPLDPVTHVPAAEVQPELIDQAWRRRISSSSTPRAATPTCRAPPTPAPT